MRLTSPRLLPRFPRHSDLGWTPYAWLVYLGFFLAQPILGKVSNLELAATAAGLAVFLVLYFAGFWLEEKRGLQAAGGIALLGFLFAPFNPGASVFPVYAAGFLGHCARPAVAARWMLALIFAVSLESWWLGLTPFFWIPAILFVIINGGINIHFGEVARSNARLRLTQEEVERLAKTAERERIARDLHDLLGHTLSLITLKAELAGKLVERDPERAGREIREVEAISRDALREVRSVVGGYRSEGLQAELGRARLILETAGVKLEYFAAPVELDPAREAVLALALREAVTNVVRHAGAATCRITVEPGGSGTRLEVRDDGRGSGNTDGVGLSAMRERVEGLGGRMGRRTDGGTVVEVFLPERKGPDVQEPEAGIGALPEAAH